MQLWCQQASLQGADPRISEPCVPLGCHEHLPFALAEPPYPRDLVQGVWEGTGAAPLPPQLTLLSLRAAGEQGSCGSGLISARSGVSVAAPPSL